jgi:hypothetical protein
MSDHITTQCKSKLIDLHCSQHRVYAIWVCPHSWPPFALDSLHSSHIGLWCAQCSSNPGPLHLLFPLSGIPFSETVILFTSLLQSGLYPNGTSPEILPWESCLQHHRLSFSTRKCFSLSPF